MAQAGMIQCNECKKQMSVKGIKIQIVTAGEFQAQFFRCVHCGKRYFVGVSDEANRAALEEIKRNRQRLTLGRSKKYRPSTLKKIEREGKKLLEAFKAHSEEIRPIGQRLADGESLEDILKGTAEQPEGSVSHDKA